MSVLQSERQHNKHQVVAEGNKRVFLPHLSVVLTGVESPQRKNVEDYIATQFFKNHAARVNSFLPFLLSAETKKFLKKSISTTLLCKIFDETPGNIEDMTIEQYNKLKEQSRIRGHDPKTRISIYRNPNNK